MANQTKNGLLGSDDRIKKSAGEDVRGLRSETEDADRTEADGTGFSREERRRMFRDEFTQEALPSPPKKDGWHFCWLTTTNPMDPIHRRIRMGYELVRAEEVPGFETYRMRSGQYDGFIGVNEMLLAKIPNELFNDIMQWVHFELPNQEDEKIRSQVEQLKGIDIGRDRPVIEVEEGMREYLDSKKPRIPTFTD